MRSIIYEKKGPIARITLQQAGTGNALDAEMAAELEEVCLRINQDDAVRAVIITGSGPCFCMGEPEAEGTASRGVQAVANLHPPVIAAINGDAFGAGLELALACDLRLATPEARFAAPETSWGLIPAAGGTQRLPRLVGRGKALEMLLTAEPVDAEEAYRAGLVNQVVPQSRLLRRAEEIALVMASRGPIALRYAKEAIYHGLDMTLAQGLGLEADLNIILQTTEDRAEGVKAFLEKTEPHFKGK